MEHLEEGTIHAWLDGELSDQQGREIERHIAECATCSAAVAEARGFVAMSSRVLTSLDDVPSGVVPVADVAAVGPAVRDELAVARARHQAAAAASVPHRAWWRHRGLIAAAAVAFVAASSFPVLRSWQEAKSASAPADETVGLLRAPAAAPVVADSSRQVVDAVAQKSAVASGAAQPSQREPVGGSPERKKEAPKRLADAPSPAPTVATTRADASKTANEQPVVAAVPLGRASVRTDSAEARRSADASARLQLGQVTTTGAASDVRAKVAELASSRAGAPAAPPRPSEAMERERKEKDEALAPSLVGCYAVRLVAVGGGPMTIAAIRLPTHVALDSTRVGGAPGEYEARDVSPESERVAGVYHWRPTGRGAFDFLVIRDGAPLQFAAVTGSTPTASGGPVTPMPAGAPVRLAATREVCR